MTVNDSRPGTMPATARFTGTVGALAITAGMALGGPPGPVGVGGEAVEDQPGEQRPAEEGAHDHRPDPRVALAHGGSHLTGW